LSNDFSTSFPTDHSSDHPSGRPTDNPTDSADLSTALSDACLRALVSTWDDLNRSHFDRKMRRPIFSWASVASTLAHYVPAERRIVFSQKVLLTQPWGIVQEVLKHEMAHQYVFEVLGVRDESAHGPAFRHVCAQRGIDSRAAGVPSATAAEPSAARSGPAADPGAPGAAGSDLSAAEPAPILRKVARLLALAESPNVHEADTAMRAARRLMLIHNIDEAQARVRRGFGFRHLGKTHVRIPAHEHLLATLIGRHFFVEVIWVNAYLPSRGKWGRVLEACGTPANLDVAEHVHGFVLETAQRCWTRVQQDEQQALQKNTKENPPTGAQRMPFGARRKGTSTQTRKRRYLMGLITGLDEKLDAGAQACREEGLIWSGDPALQAFQRQRYPHQRSGGGVLTHHDDAFARGQSDGRQIVIHRPVSGGPSASPSRGRLLSS